MGGTRQVGKAAQRRDAEQVQSAQQFDRGFRQNRQGE
jgi:hypothetical protein